MQEILNQLREVSNNLYWSFNNEFESILEDINRDYWKWSQKNPVKFLDSINKEYLFDIIKKKNLREKIHSLYKDYKNYMNGSTWFEKEYFDPDTPQICYLSAEYGITKCLKFYSGGLGTLSGDHMKSSSDLGLPLIGIGLGYLYGYFTQYINLDNRQAELYDMNHFESMPMRQLLDEDYKPVKICLNLPGREVFAQVWEVKIGRVKLYLLDTFVDENDAEDKRITDILYGGDVEKRILQEILLGVGGMKVLETLGYEPKAFHINEGHSAFLVFERIKKAMKKFNIGFKEARDMCYWSNIFTTHTPVPAGIDIFPRWMMEKYFRSFAENDLKIGFDDFMREGDLKRNVTDNFNMACLAINNSNFVNGVSKLHGAIARRMWALPETRSQIVSITNGVHTKTYLSRHSERLYIRHFGKNWENEENIWGKVAELPDTAIWETRNKNRRRLIKFVREKMLDKCKALNCPEEKAGMIEEMLDENALTIGFARRFATYKRGNLIFRDIERLKKILSNTDMKVQFVFSGKAHPKDEGGKNLIAEIMSYSMSDEFRNKIVFLDNYDADVAKQLVSGCDVWLNNPRRPLEASGTSGMKVIANFGINFSIQDGWWIEGYTKETGWEIKSPENADTLPENEVDSLEAISLYDTLENEIIPLFYKRNGDKIPKDWVKKIKGSIRNLTPVFNTSRMVKEYTDMFYMKVK